MTYAPDQTILAAIQPFARVLSNALRDSAPSQGDGVWVVDVAQDDSGLASPEQTRAITAAWRFHGGLAGSLFFSVNAATATKLLSGSEALPPEGIQEAWLSWTIRTKDEVLEALEGVLDPVTIETLGVTSDAADALPLTMIALRRADGLRMQVVVHMDRACEVALQKAFARNRDEERVLAVAEQNQGAPLHRVIDVPLAVTLRFGQRQLTLREVLALNTGSLVELDRQVEEPVDLMLGDRLIARGEVVIVDGNYGMRITEVVEGTIPRLHSFGSTQQPAVAGRTLPETAER